MVKLIEKIKEEFILTFTALKSGSTVKDVGKEGSKEVGVEILKHIPEFAKIVPFLDKLIEFFENTKDRVERNEVVRFYKTIRDASEKAGIGDAEINFREFLSRLKEEFETFNLGNWSGDPIDIPGATLVLEMAGVKDDDKKARYYYHFRRLFIENFKNYYEELKTRDGEIKFLEKLEEAKRLADYKFLEELEAEIGEIPPIKKYYLPNPCCRREYSEWIEGAKRYCPQEKNVREVIYNFINSDEKVLLLAADFGTGKTTASKYFVSELAENYFQYGYIPLYFKLSKYTAPKIKRTVEDINSVYQKVFIVLDGLDEISVAERNEILNFIDDYLTARKNTKTIVTCRFGIYSKSEETGVFFRKLWIDCFYQLMPLTEELANRMLKNLGGLTLDELKKFGINEEEYTKPIYLYLLWVLKKAGKLEKLAGYGKSGVYFSLTNLISRYKAKCIEDRNVTIDESRECLARKVLIHVAVLKNLFDKLSLDDLEELLADDLKKELKKLGEDFLITTYLREPNNLEFVHKSFQEYLSAEYLFICFLSGKFEGLYLFPLTQEILEFLRGLAKMFSICIKSGELEEFRELIDLAGISEDVNLNELTTRAKNYLKEFYIIPSTGLLSTSDFNFKCCRIGYKTKSKNKLSLQDIIKTLVSGKIAIVEIGQALSNNKLLKNLKELEVESLVEVLKYNYLAGLNLSEANLKPPSNHTTVTNTHTSHISHITATNSPTSPPKSGKFELEFYFDVVDIKEINLEKAYLSKADLSGACFKEVNLSGADLSMANLSGANLIEGVNLNMANLAKANLKGAHILELPAANLEGANLKRADLSSAIMVEAVLNNADLTEANLEEAILFRVVWKDNPPIVRGANFKNAKIDDIEFIQYLKENGAINVPDETTSADEI